MTDAALADQDAGSVPESKPAHELQDTNVQRVAQGLRALRATDSYDRIAETFYVLAEPSRVKIVDALVHQELCTSDLAAIIGISEPAVSQHLRLLRMLRVVRGHRHGNRVFYSLDDEHVRSLLALTVEHLEHTPERDLGNAGGSCVSHSQSHSAHHRGPASAGTARRMRPLAWALAVILVFMVVEVAGALLSGSLALIADAGHSATDVAALGLALVAAWLTNRPNTARRTYGYLRVEVMAALLNGLMLWAIAGYIFWEAGHRIASPPEVRGGIVILVASFGLAANTIAGLLLMRGSRESINVRGALLHVTGDALGSVGVIIAGVLVLTMGWSLADPIISVAIGFIILTASYRLVRDAINVLLEAAPRHTDVAKAQRTIEASAMVMEAHDIHIWSITPGYDAMSAHVVITSECAQASRQQLLDEVRHLMAKRFNISHMTVQLEEDGAECEEAHVPVKIG